MIGNQTSEAVINNVAGTLAVNLRNACQQILNFQAWLVGVGAAGLQSGYGFSATDATNLVNAVNYLNTVAEIFDGNASQPTNFNFDNAVSVLYGGQ